jgi:uncharacterized membrane protein YeaQ/YmgE (transglycosylase-associated protein family)
MNWNLKFASSYQARNKVGRWISEIFPSDPRPGFVVHWKATSAGVNPSYDVGYTAGDWDSSYEDADGKAMKLIITGIAAGVVGTLVMDILNHLFSRTGMLAKIDVGMIGRMSAGWMRGRLRHRHPDDIAPVPHEVLLGYLSHYAIGLGLAFTYVLGWYLLIGGPESPAWALAYGIATTVASWFIVFPSMGLGICGRRSPEGIRSPLSSLTNHLFYGIGLAVAVALV